MTMKMEIKNYSAGYGDAAVLKSVSMGLYANERLAIIGPAGSGKSTLLRSLNRLNELTPGFNQSGLITLDGVDICSPGMDIPSLRRRVGMVYALPTPLPWTIYDNIAYGPRLSGIKSKSKIDELVEMSLKNSFLWDEVKDRLKDQAWNLSGGQQQRLCLARVLALQPEVLILDEPCSGLDPISTAKIEEAMDILRKEYSIILVTNNTKQAARASDRTAFLLMGELVEIGSTQTMFTNPSNKLTNDYITGHFG